MPNPPTYNVPYNGNLPPGCTDADCEPPANRAAQYHATKTCKKCANVFEGWGDDADHDAESRWWVHFDDCKGDLDNA